MLARIVDEVPAHDAVPAGHAYEPKWDGFRCVILRDGDQIELSSRMNKSLTRYFPEVVARIVSVLPERCVVDSEIILRTGEPGAERLDWDGLSQRIHPATRRVAQLAVDTPAELVCFDLLSLDDENLMPLPFRERRQRLEQVFEQVDPDYGVHLTTMTTDADLAREWFTTFEGAGLDGVMVKDLGARYEPGRRSMLKVKHRRTAEAVVIGYRHHARGSGVGSVLLGMYDERGRLVNVGGIGAFSQSMREALLAELEPLVAPEGEGVALPASNGRVRLVDAEAQYVALRPELVAEVEFDQLEGRRFRHAVTLVRWRPDRDPRSCTLDQVEVAAGYDLGRVLSR
ncbi:ATP-dependent DNA ligase [Aestuariimicrobium ganziense]|uniref:ATP-dependent DNA ligase n=1 Tax=Aestuariimicrobium ganziense TaxID=2773677 RepID=UPI001F1A0247|nr:ATP-dependent DNA ligase [Aestuariimicrobium ganziense]